MGAGAVGVDVVDGFRSDLTVGQRQLHAVDGTCAAGGRCGEVVGGMTVDVALCLVGAVLVALVTLGLKKSDGALMRAGGEKVQWAPQGISYALVLASCVLGVLVVVAAASLGSNVADYLMFAMVAWLFALVVYYTVKMM